MVIRRDWRIEFEQLGPEEMRKRISSSIFNPEKVQQAREWLDEKEFGEERAYRRDSSQTARSAKNAAWIAAIAAIIAAICAIIATFSPFWKP